MAGNHLGKIWERTRASENEAKSHRINGPYVLERSHNPKVVSSNLTPATNLRSRNQKASGAPTGSLFAWKKHL